MSSDLFRPNRFRPIPLQAKTALGQDMFRPDLFRPIMILTCSGLTCLGQCRFRPTCRRRVGLRTVGPRRVGPRRVEGPKFRAASGPPGLHTTARELQTCTFQGPSLQNTTQIPREDLQENENCGGRGQKTAKFWALRRRGGPREEGGSGRGGSGGRRSGGAPKSWTHTTDTPYTPHNTTHNTTQQQPQHNTIQYTKQVWLPPVNKSDLFKTNWPKSVLA